MGWLDLILVVGSINMDICMNVPHNPEPGETVLAKGILYDPGGKGADQAVAASKLGGDVHLIGCVGADSYGKELISGLEGYGVKTGAVKVDEKEPSGMAFISISDAGQNAIVVNSGANYSVSPEQLMENESLFDAAQFCILQMEIPIETVFKAIGMCREKGIKIIFNPSPIQPLPDEALYGVDFLVPNEIEAQSLIGEDVDGLSDVELSAFVFRKGIKNMLLTLGERGCAWVSPGAVRRFSATKVSPVDTTGAGDSFLGAFAYGMSEGLSIEKSIELATKAAGITVTRFGAQRSLPYMHEIT